MGEIEETLQNAEGILREAEELFARGSREYFLKCYPEATENLSKSCELFRLIHGENGKELGLPYLMYARSLIALARRDSNIIDVSETNEDSNGSGTKNENKDGTKIGDEIDDSPDSNESNDDEAGNEDEEPLDLRVAWEVLEVAAKIFELESGPQSSVHLADVYTELASISMENSNFGEAILDYTRALDIHAKLSDKNPRATAEICYKIGLAHMMLGNFDDSVEHMRHAAELIEEEISLQISKGPLTSKTEVVEVLEEVKQDIRAKMAEIEESRQQTVDVIKNELSQVLKNHASTSSQANSGEGFLSISLTQPTDVTHLIKRKKTE